MVIEEEGALPEEQDETQYETQQISPDLFEAAEQENPGGENAAAIGKGPLKKTFTELRKNKPIPESHRV